MVDDADEFFVADHPFEFLDDVIAIHAFIDEFFRLNGKEAFWEGRDLGIDDVDLKFVREFIADETDVVQGAAEIGV